MASRLELTSIIRRNNEEMNRRVSEVSEYLLEIGWTDQSGFLKKQFEKFRTLTDTKSKKRLATGNLSRMNKKKLENMIEHQNQFLSSKWSTRQGRIDIMNKSRETLARNRGLNLTLDGYMAYTKIVSDNTIGGVLTEVHIESGMVMKLMKKLDVYAQENLYQTFDFLAENFDVNSMDSLELLNLAEIVSHRYFKDMTLADLDEDMMADGYVEGREFYEDIRDRYEKL